jgi:ketosteroid isomerase-like protein
VGEAATATSPIAEVLWLKPYPDALLDGAIARETIELAYLAAIQHLPARRADWGPATEPSAAERAVLRRYVAASGQGDLSELTALLREDARQTMPPVARVYEGRAAILDLWRPVYEGPDAWGAWRSVETVVNRQPAAVNYVRAPGDTAYRAVNIDVLRIEDGLIAEITTFGPELLPALGLPATL